MGQINLEVLDSTVLEETDFGPNMDRWLTNVVDIVNASFATLNNALSNIFATGLSTVGGSGPGPYTITVSGLTPSGFVTANIVSSTNQVVVKNTTPGSGNFTIIFSADPGAGTIIVYQAYATQPLEGDFKMDFLGIGSFLHPEDAYKKAEDQSRKYYREAQGFEKPYMQHGQDVYGGLSGAFQNLLNPAQLQNQWAQGYQTSPYAQQLLQQNQSQGLDAASTMGLMGSSGALGNIQQGAGDIVSKDRQQYLNDLMQKYMQAIGLGENIYGVGAGAAGNLATGAQKQGENMAGLEYGRQAAPGQLFGNLLGAGINAAANYYMPGAGNITGQGGLGGGNSMGANTAGKTSQLFNAGNMFNR